MALGWIFIALYVATAISLWWLAHPLVTVVMLALLVRFIYRVVTGKADMRTGGGTWLNAWTYRSPER
ncbi:MAG: hypothetical protein KDH88_17635 [Chromatiales bacterium]|nr:hypothetical protein [Chromatiales bacterium]